MDGDLLMYNPDMVIVDFSVNDKPTAFYLETFEGLIRRILSDPSQPGILILNNAFYDSGVSAQNQHNAVADYYGIPFMSMRDTIYQGILDGTYKAGDLSPDGLHPNDAGHRLLADMIIEKLESLYGEYRKREEQDGEPDKKAGASSRAAEEDKGFSGIDSLVTRRRGPLPGPLTDNVYEKTVRYSIRDCHPKLEGFRVDTHEKNGHLDLFKNGWTGSKKGDKITFEIMGSSLAVQYRKTIDKPAPVARLILDNDEDHTFILDGNFEETWGDKLQLDNILYHGKYKMHTVEIEIIEADENTKTPFYLTSLTAS